MQRRLLEAAPLDNSNGVASPTRHNFIDDYIFGNLETLGVSAAIPTSDAKFIRRLSIDLTDRIPEGDRGPPSYWIQRLTSESASSR